MMTMHRTASRAMTLIELMFVVVILGLLLGVGMPRMSGSGSRAELDSTGRNMARLAAYARQSAVSRQQPVMITFDRKERTWWLDLEQPEDNRPAWADSRREPRRLTQEEERHTLPRSVEIREILVKGKEVRDDKIVVTFYPNGSSSGITVILENTRGTKLTIEVEQATSRAMAYLGEPITFAQRLADAGLDPTQFGLDPTGLDSGQSGTRDTGFYRIGDESREKFYEDAVARIMGRTQAEMQRQLDQQRQAEQGARR